MSSLIEPSDVLEREFLPLRGKLIEVAAALDRIHRSGGYPNDPRMESVSKGLQLLGTASEAADRAEKIQMIFSLPYDPQWRQK
jgi:hypothetical protein